MKIVDRSNGQIAMIRMQINDRSLCAIDHCDAILQNALTHNPEIGAYSQILVQSAKDEAALIDSTVGKMTVEKPLAGVAVAIKDNVDTTPATCPAGLEMFRDYTPEYDAAVVAALRRAGAVILGVTCTDSGAFGVTTPAVVNPCYPQRIVGGSSGGSAAAVAGGLCDAAIGTDTGGSIRIPAACCGVYGFKPTYGRVSLGGVRPLGCSYDHVGPLASSIDDIIELMCVVDADFRRDMLKSTPLNPIIGVPRNCFEDASKEVLEITEDYIQAATDAGISFQDVFIPTPEEVLPHHITLSMKEASDLYSDLEGHAFETFPAIARQSLAIGRSVTSQEYEQSVQAQAQVKLLMEHVFEQIDFLLMPTLPVLPPSRNTEIILVDQRPMEVLPALIRYTATFNQTGNPALLFLSSQKEWMRPAVFN